MALSETDSAIIHDKELQGIFLNLMMNEQMESENLSYLDPKGFLSFFLSNDPDENNIPFYLKVIMRRIEVCNLNLTLTKEAYASFCLFPDRIGAAVIMLIDILEEFGETTVSFNDICMRLYPYGFYNEEALEKRIEEMKEDKTHFEDQRKIKYSYLY